MENILIYVIFMVACPIYNNGYTTGNKKSSHLLNIREGVKDIEGGQHSTELVNASNKTNVLISSNLDNAGDKPVDISSQTTYSDQVRRLIKKRDAGKAVLNFLGGIGKGIGELLGLTKTEIKNQGLTNEQLNVLIAEIAKSGASRAKQTSTIILWILPFIGLNVYMDSLL